MKIFFSYGHDKHAEVVRKLADRVEELSDGTIEVWIDSQKIPYDCHWRTEITEGIRECDDVVTFLSNYSVREESVCRDELYIALVSKHGMVHTVLLEPEKEIKIPSVLSEYQWENMSDYHVYLSKGNVEFENYISEKAQKIIDIVNSNEVRKYSSETKLLRSKLNLPEVDRLTKFDLLSQKDIFGRSWLFERVSSWIKDKSESQIMMVYGKPGSGKSMFAAHFPLRNPYVVASFPCDFRSNEFSNTESIIKNIAYRLALRLPDYRKYLIGLEDKYFTCNDASEYYDYFERLIARPLSGYNIDGGRDSLVIEIDALDEMNTELLSKFIAEYAPCLRKYVRFLITARKNPEIVERFNKYPFIDLDSETENGERDLREFYENRLENIFKSDDERTDFINRLVENSEMMFAYAECVCTNIIVDSKNKEFTLRDYPLPHGLEELYKTTLDRFFGDGARYSIEDYENKWQVPLGMIIASPEPVPVETFKKLNGWGENAYRKFMYPLSTLIVVVDGCLQVFHKSFAEWLDSTWTKYNSSYSDGINNLAEKCFELYQIDMDNPDEYTMNYLPFLLKEAEITDKYNELICNRNFSVKLLDYIDKLDIKNNFFHALKIADNLSSIIYDAEIIENDNSLITGIHKVRCLNYYVDIYNKLRKTKEARNFSEKFYNSSKELTEKFPDSLNVWILYSVAVSELGHVNMEENKLNKAIECYNDARIIIENLTRNNSDNYDLKARYINVLTSLGNIHSILYEYVKAEKYYLNALDKCEESFDNDILNKMWKCTLLQKTGHNYEMQNEFEIARDYYNKSLVIYIELAEVDKEYALRCGDIYKKIAEIERKNHNTENALVIYKKLKNSYLDLIEKNPENINYRIEYGVLLDDIAEVYWEKDKLEIVSELYNESLSICRKICDMEPSNDKHWLDYSDALLRVGEFEMIGSNYIKSLESYNKALDIITTVMKSNNENPIYQERDYLCYFSIAELFHAWKKFDEAYDYYKIALKKIKLLREKYPEQSNLDEHYYRVLERIRMFAGFIG